MYGAIHHGVPMLRGLEENSARASTNSNDGKDQLRHLLTGLDQYAKCTSDRVGSCANLHNSSFSSRDKNGPGDLTGFEEELLVLYSSGKPISQC